MPWKTPWSLSVDGRDASDAFNDFLVSISIDEKEGKGGDTASLKLDDTGGVCILPRAGAFVAITLDGVLKFEGFTEDPDCEFTLGGGRTISVHCTSQDSRGPAKDAQRWHQDGGTFSTFLTRAAKSAGMTITIDPAFASIARDWWSPSGASFLHLGERWAAELGAVFKVKGNKAVFAQRGTGLAANGAALAEVIFDCADGTIAGINATPLTGKSSRSTARTHWFDRKNAKWQKEDVAIDRLSGAPESRAIPRYARATQADAQRAGKGRKDDAAHDKGKATVHCDLRVRVSIGAPATIRNDRPGVDGSWKVRGASHHLDRGGGGKSSFTLGRPSDAAGSDSRKTPTSATSKPGAGTSTSEAGSVPGASTG